MLVLTGVPLLPGKLVSCSSGVPTELSTSIRVVGVPARAFSSLACSPAWPTLLEASYGGPSCYQLLGGDRPDGPHEMRTQLLGDRNKAVRGLELRAWNVVDVRGPEVRISSCVKRP